MYKNNKLLSFLLVLRLKSTKRLVFLGLFPKPVDPRPWVHLGVKMSLLDKNVGFTRPKTMDTKISHKL